MFFLPREPERTWFISSLSSIPSSAMVGRMCGIAGIIDLVGERPAPSGVVRRMARAIVHRGPDEEGFFERPGISMASRRLSIVGLADGQQPLSTEDHSAVVVFNGELFD